MPEKHYFEQIEYTETYLIPYFSKHIKSFRNLKILEIGCAEAGTLSVLKNLGHKVTGLEIDETRAKLALEKNPDMNIKVGDISSCYIVDKIAETYDLIIMREVIEHIPNKGTTFYNIDRLLKNGGYFFVTFPPKYSPFAGHQQVGRSFLKKTPYVHLLPELILNKLTSVFGESNGFVNHLKKNYSTGMVINKFESYLDKLQFESIIKDLYLLRPIYTQRYGTKVRKLPNIPLIREFITFGYEGLFRKREASK